MKWHDRYTDTQIHRYTHRDLDIMTTTARRAAAVKTPQSGICPVPCAFQQCASPLCFWGRPHCRLPLKVSSIKGRLPSNVVFHQMSSSVKGRLPSKVVFCQRSSSVKCRLPSNVVFQVVFHQRSSSVKGCLRSKVVFRQGSSSIKGCLLLKVVFVWRSSSVEGCLLSKVVFRQRSYSIEVRLPLLGHFHFWVLVLSVA